MVKPVTSVRDQRSSARTEAEAPRVKRAPRTAQEKQLLARESGNLGGGAQRYARLAAVAPAAPEASTSSLSPARRLVPRARKARIVLSQHRSPTPSSQDKGKARAMDTQPTVVLAARQIMIAGVTETAGAAAAASTSAAVLVATSAKAAQPTVSLAASSSSVMLLHADSAVGSVPASQLNPLSTALRPSTTPSSVWSEPAPTSSWSSIAGVTSAASLSAATTAPVPSLQPATFAPVLATSPTASPSTAPFSLKHNTPLQLLIIIGSVVVFATLVTGFAWLFRSLGVCGTSRKRKREKSDWSPSAPSNGTFPPVDHHATALKWVNSFSSDPRRDGSKADDDVVGPSGEKELPQLTNPHGTPSRPPPAAQQQDGHGWQLYDAPVPSSRRGSVREEAVALPSNGGGGNYGAGIALALGGGRIPDAADMESAIGNNAWVPPARRPSFIERILMQRAGSAGMPSVLSGEDERCNSNLDPEAARPVPDDQYTQMPGRASRAITGRRGSLPQPRNTLLSVFMRNNAPNNARNKHRRRHSAALLSDSDFEGTIGGRDGELPMAKRLGKKDGRFACDDSTDADKSSPGTLSAALQPFSSSFVGPALCMTPAGICATPHTPGLAGVGSAWAQKADAVAMPRPVARNEPRTATTLAELKRQQVELDVRMAMSGNDAYGRGKLEAKVGRWMETSRNAEFIASPLSAAAASLSSARQDLRRTGGAEASREPLRRQATMTTLSDSSISSLDAYALGGAPLAPLTSRAMELQMPDHSPAPSIRPHFAATTTLSSWLVEDEKHGLHEEDSAEVFSILDKYQASPLPGKQGALHGVPVLSMRTGRSSLPPSYESPGSSPSRNSSAYDEAQFTRSPEDQVASSVYTSECSTPVSQGWGAGEEVLEEERRQVDRRQKLMRKEQRQAARALAREQARAQALELTPEAEQAHAQDPRHVVLDMAAGHGTVDLSTAAELTRAQSFASSSMYSGLSGASEYAAPVFAGQALANAGMPPRRAVAPGHQPRFGFTYKTSLPRKHLDGDALVAAAALHSVPALKIQPRRQSAISPPDSPWSSDSEATRWAGGRRAPGTFIVQQARSASYESSTGTAYEPLQPKLLTVSATARPRVARERDIPPTGYTTSEKRAPAVAAKHPRASARA